MSNNEFDSRYYEIDRGLYNNIIKAYGLIAATRVLNLDRKQMKALIAEYRYLFDTIDARKAESLYGDIVYENKLYY